MARGRILLAHPDTDCRVIIGAVLRAREHEVVETGDGDEAFTMLASSSFDVVVTDLFLPSQVDECLLRRLRSEREPSEAPRKLPVVVVTGWANEPHEQMALALGVDRFVAMPVVPTDLATMVEDLMPGIASVRAAPMGYPSPLRSRPTPA